MWLTVSASACLSIVFLRDFYLTIVALVAFISCSACANVVSAISVNLFPTNIRGMAMCFIYRFGRIGSAFGSNIIALLVENQCDSIFYIFVPLLVTCVIVFMMIKQDPPKSPKATPVGQ